MVVTDTFTYHCCCARWIYGQVPPDFFGLLFETIPLLLPMLMLAVLFCTAMCVQACSGSSSASDDSAERSRQHTAAADASQVGDDDMHDRYSRTTLALIRVTG